MIYAEILAGGKGTRMGTTAKPKQFIEIANKPILIHTIEAFLHHKKIDKIIVCLPKNWIDDSIKLFEKYFNKNELKKICPVIGGNDRQESMMNGCYFIRDSYGLSDDDIILTHDGVRPFITQRIIDDNIKALKNCSATDTVVPAIDTIVESLDLKTINSIPNRTNLFYGQSPQSFNLKELINVFENITEKEKNILTDACKAFALKGKEVILIDGEYSNMKITTPSDLIIAEAIYQSRLG